MGYNLRVLSGVPKGVRMDFRFALLPLTNLTFAIRLLGPELAATGGDVARALARYNGGPSGEKLEPGPNGLQFRTQAYVDRVAEHARKVRADVFEEQGK